MLYQERKSFVQCTSSPCSCLFCMAFADPPHTQSTCFASGHNIQLPSRRVICHFLCILRYCSQHILNEFPILRAPASIQAYTCAMLSCSGYQAKAQGSCSFHVKKGFECLKHLRPRQHRIFTSIFAAPHHARPLGCLQCSSPGQTPIPSPTIASRQHPEAAVPHNRKIWP
jgi:hypothetical protein